MGQAIEDKIRDGTKYHRELRNALERRERDIVLQGKEREASAVKVHRLGKSRG